MQRISATLIAVVAVGLGIAYAQNSPGVPVGGAGVTQQQLDAAMSSVQSTVMAAMPKPAAIVPPTDTTTGAVGISPDYMRADAPRPARYRAGNCTIAGGAGQCTIPWSTPFAVTPQPLGDPAVLNPNFATAQLTCNWVTMTVNNGTVICRSSILSLAILGNILTALGNGATVYGTAVQPL